MRIPNNNIVDRRLKQLTDMGKIDDVSLNKYNQEYWDKFISFCDEELCKYVLKFPQTGNWNGWLYAACEKRLGRKPNR